MTLLLLAGTGEARALAKEIAQAGIPAVATLAGATLAPAELPLTTFKGGFGGADGFRAFVAQHGITRVLDATHPFADAITNRTTRLCAEMGLQYLHLRRPPWEPAPDDRWTFIDAPEDAAAYVHEGQVVFLATGRQTVAQFANLAGATVYARQIDPPKAPFPFAEGAYIMGKPPFPVAAEEALFQRLKIDWLITKNAGGSFAQNKLIAARNLGLPVLMINRPAAPDAPCVASGAEAMAWVRQTG